MLKKYLGKWIRNMLLCIIVKGIVMIDQIPHQNAGQKPLKSLVTLRLSNFDVYLLKTAHKLSKLMHECAKWENTGSLPKEFKTDLPMPHSFSEIPRECGKKYNCTVYDLEVFSDHFQNQVKIQKSALIQKLFKRSQIQLLHFCHFCDKWVRMSFSLKILLCLQ